MMNYLLIDAALAGAVGLQAYYLYRQMKEQYSTTTTYRRRTDNEAEGNFLYH